MKYVHRNSTLGDSVANCLPEDLHALNKSAKLNQGIDQKQRVINVQNKLQGVESRRGDGTFGEIVPNAKAIDVPGFVVARGAVATVEIGTEVKILAKAMIKQIDRVMTDLLNQKKEFSKAGGTPITVGIVGINQAARYVSYEKRQEWPTDLPGHKHPIQEAADAEKRLMARVAAEFDEFLILRFRATNEPPFKFEWVNQHKTELEYGAVLIRIVRKYEARF